ncbi:MAG: DsrE family protein, partial [Thermodesulfobacteriota bacterium]|nr:DsrE family protein [Thermodesulfobacteriota bacterium]
VPENIIRGEIAMEIITIIINDAPYGIEKPWNALRLAKALVATKQKVNIFLMGDAVGMAKNRQQTPTGYYNLAQMLRELIALGVEIRACGTCINSRGLKEDELVEGVIVGKMLDLARWVPESVKVITF